MSDVLASQVAAGEVVERPASVVKELVENSIDAGATAIRVEIRRGGVSLIKVTDNGKGMSRTDADMCLERHATSKLKDFADLFSIQQLGFRGEALPSIASVSEMSILTRRAQDVEGSLVTCSGGNMQSARDAGCAPGTEICVSNLFFNTPVRRKFLKSDDTEAGHIEHQLKLHALAFPTVRFTLLKDGQLVYDLPATSDLRRRIADLLDRDLAEKLLRIRPTNGPGVRVEGFLMPLSEARRNRRMQFVFLNGRPVEDLIVARAVRDGYGGFPTGLHPALFLYLEVDPGLVDVNVHPAKKEVRFRRPSDVTTTIIDAVAGTLAEYARGESTPDQPAPPPVEKPVASPVPTPAKPVETPHPSTPTQASPSPQASPFKLLRPVLTPRQQELELPPATTPAPPPDNQQTSAPTHAEERGGGASDFRYIGQLKGQFLIFENKDGMVLLAPRAARERIIFERLLQSNRTPLVSQRLIQPELLELDARDFGVAKGIIPHMEQAGFVVSPFGRNTLRVEAVPALLKLNAVSDFLLKLISLYANGEVRAKRARNPFEPFAIELAGMYARKENPEESFRKPEWLLNALLQCEIPYCTPTGKPTMLPYSLSEIRRKFDAR